MRWGNPRIGRDGTSDSVRSASAVGLPHASSATIARRNGSPTTASEGQIAFQLCRRPRHESEGRLLQELGELVGGESIDRRSELDPSFAVGLQAVARRALPAVAHAHRQRIAGAQIAAADTDQQSIGIGPDVEPVEPHLELGAVARLDGGEVRRRRACRTAACSCRRWSATRSSPCRYRRCRRCPRCRSTISSA